MNTSNLQPNENSYFNYFLLNLLFPLSISSAKSKRNPSLYQYNTARLLDIRLLVEQGIRHYKENNAKMSRIEEEFIRTTF